MISIELNNRKFRPGDPVTGTVVWESFPAGSKLEIRLIWFTSGKGTTDFATCAVQSVPETRQDGRSEFEFTAPDYPFSYSGNLISIRWAIEVIRFPDKDSELEEITIAPNRTEIVLPGE